MKPVVVISSLDADFCLWARHILEADGFTTDLAMGPVETVSSVKGRLNVGLLIDGRMEFAVELCRSLKEDPDVAHVRIIALLPGHASDHFGSFLDAGVDEAFVRPVEPRRYLRALKRVLINDEARLQAEEREDRLDYAGLVIDLRSHRIVHGSREIRVGPIEFRLLRQLMSEPTRVFRRDELILGAWPRGVFVDLRTVNVHIGRLRRALNQAMRVDIIRTVRGVGYALDLDLP